MSVENTQRDEETAVLPIADEEETTVLPTADDALSTSSEEVPPAEQDEAPALESDDTAMPHAAAPASQAGPATPASAGSTHRQEAPANGIRVAQLVWAGLVIMLGIFMIAISFLRFVSIPLLLISLIAALGIALMAAAVVTSVKKG